MAEHVLAVDVGATKVAIGLVNSDCEVLQKFEVSTRHNSRLWEEIEELTRSLCANVTGKVIGVGIGSAGPLHVNIGAISPVNIPQWRYFPIVQKFAEVVGTQNICLHGDAMALAHAEHKLGAGRGIENFLGVVVSTGIGGGLILGNQLVMGETGNAGYLGHQIINFEGTKCACGRQGCVESYASGPSMVATALQRSWKGTGSSTFIHLADSARNGDPIALEVIDEGTHALAIGIVNVLESLDISTVVVGGGVSEAGTVYWEPLRKHLKSESLSIGFSTEINLRLAQLSRNSGLIGAALGVLDSKEHPLNSQTNNFANALDHPYKAEEV